MSMEFRLLGIFCVGVLLASGMMGSSSRAQPSTSTATRPSSQGSLDEARLAGEYRRAYVRFVRYLTLDRDGTFTARVQTDNGHTNRIEGRFHLDGTLLKFFADGKEDQGAPKSLLSPLRIVPWGERIYLVLEDELGTFVAAVNDDWFLRWGIRRPHGPTPPFGYEPADDKGRVFGIPELPAEWRQQIRQTAIVGAIEKIETETTVRLSVGGRQGVTPGLHFDLLGGDGGTSARLEVVTVAEESSQAILSDKGIAWPDGVVLARVPLPTTTGSQATGGESATTEPAFDRVRLTGMYWRRRGNDTVTFELRASGRFSAFISTDASEGELVKGTFDVEGRTIRLAPTREPQPGGYSYLDRQPLWIVPWGERVFLVAEDKLEAFTKDVNDGWVFRWNRGRSTVAWARASDVRKRVFGIPELPGEWRGKVWRTAIVGIIDEVLEKDAVRLNVGTKHGVKLGMHFWAPHSDQVPSMDLEVTEVAETSCRARVQAGGPPMQGSEMLTLVTPEATATTQAGGAYRPPSTRPGSR